MAHGEFIMNKVNEELVENTPIDMTTAQARARLRLYIAVNHRPAKAYQGEKSRDFTIIPDTDFDLTPLDILNLHFFSKSAWGMPSMSKERDNGQVLKTTPGLNLPLVKGATFADYAALLFKACGWDYHPYIGKKTYEEVKAIMEKEE